MTYYETLSNAVMAGLATKLPKDVILNCPDDITWEPMGYETSQVKLYPLSKWIDSVTPPKPLNRCLSISIYRMPSGRYETTAYLT